ncbi:MAG: hypothetical protein JWO80_523 [Bryobacterales bacterium]|nr:hypothetical protein [Bryobacterales bacterium]
MRHVRLTFCLPVLIGLTPGLCAQPAGFGVPLVGFVLDPRSHSIRPVQGLPGAALVGKALDLPLPFAKARFGLRDDFALAVEASDAGRVFVLHGLRTGTPSATILDGSVTGVQLIALNDEQSAAALYSPTSSQLQFVTGLPGHPAVTPSVSLSGLPGEVLAIVLNTGGTSALVCMSDGATGQIYAASGETGGVEPVAQAFSPIGALFYNQGRDAVFADAVSDELVLIRDIHGARERSTLAAQGSFHGAVAIARGKDQHVLVAGAGSMNVVDFDLQQGIVVSTTDLPVTPTRFDALFDPNVFVINPAGSGPLYLWNSVSTPAVSFVPFN